MKITVVGTGYVGLVTGACFAETGNQVVCVDADPKKVDSLRLSKIPFYEPNLEELVARNFKEGRLMFSSHLSEALLESSIGFICVGTPSLPSGEADLSQVFSAAEQVAELVKNKPFVLVIKSTVPVATGDRVESRLREKGYAQIKVVSNPEFLREGSAVQDCLLPDRVVVGTDQPEELAEFFKDLYRPYVRTGNPIIIMDRKSAELSKYAGNAFLAMRIAFINEMSRLCEAVDGDIRKVREAMGADHRIGMQYLFPSIGFGGSCFPKDVRALNHFTQEAKLTPYLLKATLESNEEQKKNFVRKIMTALGGPEACKGKKLAVWGVAFKAKTDDIRESAALTVIDGLLEAGIAVTLSDPEALENAKKHYQSRVNYAQDMYDALKGSDGLCVLTEWNQFRFPDFNKVKSLLRTPIIFDGRNLYETSSLNQQGLTHVAVGLKTKDKN